MIAGRAAALLLAIGTAILGAPVMTAKTDEPARSEYPMRAVPLTAVRLTDSFWRPRMETNRTVTIPHILQQNELTGRVDNFLKAAHRMPGPYQGQRYNDTDAYKVIEARSPYFDVACCPANLARLMAQLPGLVYAQRDRDI